MTTLRCGGLAQGEREEGQVSQDITQNKAKKVNFTYVILLALGQKS
jgi:hypothetical protein